ncbi:MAG: nickel-dependent hydrogenase large subunit [Anaerolineales bacterium]
MQKEQKEQSFVIPIGPQHPALKEPGNFNISVDGEVVTAASARLGYAHRGIEKTTERRSWVQNLYLVERVCGICSHIHGLAYSLGVEKLAGVEAPPRAQAIRTLVAELERIHSHMLWLGVAAHEAGYEALFMYSWRDREIVMDLLEAVTGNRVNYSANLLGGVKFDLTEQQIADILSGMETVESRIDHYLRVVTTEDSFTRRTRGIGIMTEEEANHLGVVGPTARASGVARDIRVEAPYAAYPEFPARLITSDAGDLEARFVVRIEEITDSIRIIRAILEDLPEGDLTTRMPRRIPAGETVSRVEAPRGELFYFIQSEGGNEPSRVKIRTPTLCNMPSVLHLTVGHNLADVPMILAGIDPCFSCQDRMISLRRSSEESEEEWSWTKLRQYGIEYYQ